MVKIIITNTNHKIVPELKKIAPGLLNSIKYRYSLSERNVMKTTLPLIVILALNTVAAQEYYLLVGTYNSAKSEGIYVYRFSSKDGSAKEVSHIKASNPSFLTVSPDKRFVYAVNETGNSTGKGGHVSSFAFNTKNGTLTFVNSQSSEGNHPCYITTDKTGKWVLAGNYSTGNFCVLPVKKGKLGKATGMIQHIGSGPDTTRQKSPHVHGIFMQKDNKGFYVTDLGTDKVMDYQFNPKSGKVTPSNPPFINMKPGSGPRHLVIHTEMPIVYVLNELTGTMTAVLVKNKENRILQINSTFPSDMKGSPGSADIHLSPDNKFLYCTNRGNANSIAIFSIDKNGIASPAGFTSTLGEKPRNFNITPDGKFLLIANQESNEIIIFRRDENTGLLTNTGNKISIGKPVCLQWVNAD